MIEGAKTASILSVAGLVEGMSMFVGTYQIESLNAERWLSLPQAWNSRTFDSFTNGILLGTTELLLTGLAAGAVAYSLSRISERRASRKSSGSGIHAGGII